MEHYSLGTAAMCSIIKCGINDTYLVSSTEGKFIFRVYSLDWRTVKEINEELRLIKQLKENGLSVSYPIADNNNKYIQEFDAPEGLRYGVLFSFAGGEKLHNYSAEQHYNAGVVMANFHKSTENFYLDRTAYMLRNLLVEPLEELNAFLPEKTEEFAYMKALQSYLLNELKNANEDELRKGTIHMDIWFDNMNITDDGKISLFDFDFCGNGWLSLDIAYYILQLNNVERDETICREKVNAFLNGYESISSISAEEKKLLPALGLSMYFFYLGVQAVRHDNWSNSFYNATYLKRFITQLVKRYADLNGIVIS